MRMGQRVRTGLGHGGITCVLQTQFSSFFSSPEPKAPGELIGWEGSVVCRPSSVVRRRRPSTISNDFSSETTGPIVTKFHM